MRNFLIRWLGWTLNFKLVFQKISTLCPLSMNFIFIIAKSKTINFDKDYLKKKKMLIETSE